MNILIACDKFKDSLTSFEANSILDVAVRQSFKNCSTTLVTASDGGEGFLDAIAEISGPRHASSLSICRVPTVDPLGRECSRRILLDAKSAVAYVELAEASGLGQLKPAEFNPEQTSSFGTGMQIRSAIERGAKTVVLGIGGSGTNDAGMGIAAALGFQFLDGQSTVLKPKGASLGAVADVRPPTDPDWRDRLSQVRFVTINDVSNPLCGPEGAAKIYAAQKGADDSMINRLDAGLEHFGKVIIESLRLPQDLNDTPGAGSAGGVGFGMLAFANSEFASASKWMLSYLSASVRFEDFDWVLTGEGKLDRQSCYGKWVSQLAQLARESDTHAIAFCGISELTAQQAREIGLAEVFPLHNPNLFSLEESIRLSAKRLEAKALDWCRSLGDPNDIKQEPR